MGMENNWKIYILYIYAVLIVHKHYINTVQNVLCLMCYIKQLKGFFFILWGFFWFRFDFKSSLNWADSFCVSAGNQYWLAQWGAVYSTDTCAEGELALISFTPMDWRVTAQLDLSQHWDGTFTTKCRPLWGDFMSHTHTHTHIVCTNIQIDAEVLVYW